MASSRSRELASRTTTEAPVNSSAACPSVGDGPRTTRQPSVSRICAASRAVGPAPRTAMRSPGVTAVRGEVGTGAAIRLRRAESPRESGRRPTVAVAQPRAGSPTPQSAPPFAAPGTAPSHQKRLPARLVPAFSDLRFRPSRRDAGTTGGRAGRLSARDGRSWRAGARTARRPAAPGARRGPPRPVRGG